MRSKSTTAPATKSFVVSFSKKSFGFVNAYMPASLDHANADAVAVKPYAKYSPFSPNKALPYLEASAAGAPVLSANDFNLTPVTWNLTLPLPCSLAQTSSIVALTTAGSG